MAKAEEVGAEGQVEESMKMLEEVEALKVKKTQAEVSSVNLHDNIDDIKCNRTHINDTIANF